MSAIQSIAVLACATVKRKHRRVIRQCVFVYIFHHILVLFNTNALHSGFNPQQTVTKILSFRTAIGSHVTIDQKLYTLLDKLYFIF